VLFGLGIWVYFRLSVEPPLALLWLLLTVAALPGLASRWTPVPLSLALVPAALAAGFGAAQLRTHMVAAPVLERAGVYQVEGRVVLIWSAASA
jgi:competence protein ComEC